MDSLLLGTGSKRCIERLFGALVVSAAACDQRPVDGRQEAPASPVVVSGELVRAPVPLPGLPQMEPRKVSAAEAALIEQVLTHFVGKSREEMRQLLLDPRAGVPEVHKNPEVQSILDKIASVRKTDEDSITRMQAQRAPYPVTVAVQGTLGVDGASAIIVRRSQLEPHDVILLGDSDATVEALGGAVRELVKARAKDGDIPTHDDRIVVRSRGVPRNWLANGADAYATQQLAAARNGAPMTIPGLGQLRAFEIMVPPSKK
jgi:hypothetical protein